MKSEPSPTHFRHLNLLVVDDERELRESLSQMLTTLGHKTLTAGTGEEALKMIRNCLSENQRSIHMILLDVNMPGISGLEVLRRVRVMDPSITILIITAHGSIRDAVEAMKEGAYDYLEKPVKIADLGILVKKASEAHTLVQELGLSSPKLTLDNGEEFIGNSKQMRAVFQVIHRLGRVNTSVLIRGENGTGKRTRR
jgi:DNA-binding NtrC family response regulator